MKTIDRLAFLSTPLDPAFLPTVTGFTEEAAKALGLGRAEALKLTLASEELFTYLSRVSPSAGSVEVRCRDKAYYLELSFRTPVRELDLRLFNLVAGLDPADEANLDQLGLLLASRAVERFRIVDDHHSGLRLVLSKDKSYPPAQADPPPAGPLSTFRVENATAEELILAARYLPLHYPAELYPAGLERPGRLMDMVAGGEYVALAASDDQGRLGGLLLYTQANGRTASLHGPYLFNQPPGSDMAERLVEAALGGLGKSEALGLVCLAPSPELPLEYFEPLGFLSVAGPEGRRPCYYRQLNEDLGAAVWAHPALVDFLGDFYRDLVLGRQINPTHPEGQNRPPHSVLATEINRAAASAVLRPMWDGLDARENLIRHVKVLGGEGVTDLLCEIDLGSAWQAELGGAALEAGFRPRLVLPHGGQADLLILQHRAD